MPAAHKSSMSRMASWTLQSWRVGQVLQLCPQDIFSSASVIRFTSGAMRPHISATSSALNAAESTTPWLASSLAFSSQRPAPSRATKASKARSKSDMFGAPPPSQGAAHRAAAAAAWSSLATRSARSAHATRKSGSTTRYTASPASSMPKDASESKTARRPASEWHCGVPAPSRLESSSLSISKLNGAAASEATARFNTADRRMEGGQGSEAMAASSSKFTAFWRASMAVSMSAASLLGLANTAQLNTCMTLPSSCRLRGLACSASCKAFRSCTSKPGPCSGHAPRSISLLACKMMAEAAKDLSIWSPL
mmetsp:Transcript_98502/g.248701  ORF Transcript_98502/g.248701 Transcript_98502/m.248701 type:complete len:309 (-) Transcript_98502:276-1202(-)